MAKPEIDIQLSRPDGVYRTGDPVEGTVRVRADEAFTCQRLVVTSSWRTTGEGRPYTELGERAALLEGEPLSDGEERTLPFRLAPPPGPPSYDGKRIGVGWRVRARLHVLDGESIAVDEAFVLRPDDEGRASYAGPDGAEEAEKPTPVGGFGVGLFTGCGLWAMLVGIPGPVLLWVTWPFAGTLSKVFYGLWTVAAVPAIVMGAISFRHALRAFFPQRRLGAVEWDVSSSKVRRGTGMVYKVRVHPNQDVTIRRIEASYAVSERVWDDQANLEEEEILREAIVVAEGRSVSEGETVVFEKTVKIPADAPWSLAAPDSRVEWKVGLEIELEGYGARWSGERVVIVLP